MTNCPKTIVSGASTSGSGQRNTIITLTSRSSKMKVPLMLFRGARFRRHAPKSKPRKVNDKSTGVENLMTLKQACPSEYQGAQGAFKDSMIH